MMAKLGPFMGMMGGGAAPAEGAAPAGAEGGEAAPEAKEEKKDKTHFDIELTAFDAKSKLKVVKEVRAMLGLGVKEAKELVESAPVWIKKEVKKDDAEAMVEKLTGLGGELRMV